jgi:large subunit ribosomal protein L21
MYAIIRVGGKQAKVSPGDLIDVERIKDGDTVSYVPLLVVDDSGTTITDRSALAKIAVNAKVVGESRGPKIDIFKYKNKTGYRRRQGHRQTYTTIEITGIDMPKPKAKAASKKAEATEAKKATAAKEED